MILTFNLTATETAALQARADAYNLSVTKLADKVQPPALSLDEFVTREVQLRIIDQSVSRLVSDQNDVLIASVLSLPADKRAEVEAIATSVQVSPVPLPLTLP